MSIRKVYCAALIAVVMAAAFSCGGGGRTAARTSTQDTLYMPQYARGFIVESLPGGVMLKISDPWQDARGVSHEIFLSRDGQEPPENFAGKVIPVPLKKVVCMSSTYIAFMDALGVTDAVAGVSGGKYISNPQLRERLAAGTVREVGYDTAVNYELLAALSPDVVFAYGISGENSVLSEKLARLGIPVVYIGEYVEQSPLGKAEWLVAFGYMFGQEELARQIFGDIAQRYNILRERVAGAGATQACLPVVMLNSPYRDTWFVPGDRSYMVRLIEDAGGVYACRGEDSDASRPISLETAYVKMLSADVWLNPGQATSLAEVKAENPRFVSTPPVTGGRVYNNNKRQTPEGGSDFWESGAVRPDTVLEDMVDILYPGLLGPRESYYFRKLE